ncbi:MAG: hypothetical protein HPY54_05000 [Chthonomonadetes bacterium]|nr:hypothetical protein [Chthonomonadetes bacterium]
MKRVVRVTMLPVAGILLLIGALWAQSRTQIPAVVRTQRIELMDREGRIRAELKTSGEDTLLALYDGQGRLRTLVGTESVVFYGADGKIKGRIDASMLQEGK